MESAVVPTKNEEVPTQAFEVTASSSPTNEAVNRPVSVSEPPLPVAKTETASAPESVQPELPARSVGDSEENSIFGRVANFFSTKEVPGKNTEQSSEDETPSVEFPPKTTSSTVKRVSLAPAKPAVVSESTASETVV